MRLEKRCVAMVAWLAVILASMVPPGLSQQENTEQVYKSEKQGQITYFPPEAFTQVNPTVPNEELDFNDDTNDSCCLKDVKPSAVNMTSSVNPSTDLDLWNPNYHEKPDPTFLVECQKYETIPERVSQQQGVASLADFNNIPTWQTLASFSNNVSIHQKASFITQPNLKEKTGHFHISAVGGQSLVKLEDVEKYSVCMAKGNNLAMVANSDNASVITYNGNDHIILAGNNTHMLARAGAGDDIIELYQAKTLPNNDWSSYNIYKTAISGSQGVDSFVIQATPKGTKWCHIGTYTIFGETFYVIEFALPPSVVEGPRRQRISIGRSIETVQFKGRNYTLAQFLTHGTPVDAVAQSIPINGSLPYIPVQ